VRSRARRSRPRRAPRSAPLLERCFGAVAVAFGSRRARPLWLPDTARGVWRADARSVACGQFSASPGDRAVSVRLDLQLPPCGDAPAIARRQMVKRFATELDGRLLEDARLLTSELVTNAVVHGRGTIQLHARAQQHRLIVDVADQGDGFAPTTREHAFDTVGGHGLHIVDSLASRWGIRAGGSHVWFELERARAPSGTPRSTGQLNPRRGAKPLGDT
jgi:signal transduction histidine kinase